MRMRGGSGGSLHVARECTSGERSRALGKWFELREAGQRNCEGPRACARVRSLWIGSGNVGPLTEAASAAEKGLSRQSRYKPSKTAVLATSFFQRL